MMMIMKKMMIVGGDVVQLHIYTHRCGGAADAFHDIACTIISTAIHEVDSHSDDLRFELHNTRPDVWMQRIGDRVHAEGLIKQIDMLMLAEVD